MSDATEYRASQVIGITGRIGSGKSWLTAEVRHRARAAGKACITIEVDDLRRFAIKESLSRRHVAMRRRLGEIFGIPTYGMHAKFLTSRSLLNEAAFRDEESLAAYSAATGPTLATDVRRILRGTSGPTLIECATFLDYDLCALTSNPVVIATCSDDEFSRRVDDRSLKIPGDFARRIRILQQDDLTMSGIARHAGIATEIIDTGLPGAVDRAADAIWERISYPAETYSGSRP